MKKTIYTALFVVGSLLMGLFLHPRSVIELSYAQEIKVQPHPILTHQQEVWQSALEWCESNGVLTIINPKDKDGTPSYYSFQFKPSTFKYLGVKYHVLDSKITDEEAKELLKDYQLQKDIVGFMILDKTTVWKNQFPTCVKKIGYPPRVK